MYRCSSYHRVGPCHAQGNQIGPHDNSVLRNQFGWAHALSRVPISAHTTPVRETHVACTAQIVAELQFCQKDTAGNHWRCILQYHNLASCIASELSCITGGVSGSYHGCMPSRFKKNYMSDLHHYNLSISAVMRARQYDSME